MRTTGCGKHLKPGGGLDRELLSIPCMSQLGEKEVSFLGNKGVLKRYHKNDCIFLASDEARDFFIIKTGSVKLYKTSEEGREIIIRIMGEGEHFCFAPLYADMKNMVNAEAIEETTLYAISSGILIEALGLGLNDIGLKILANMCSRVKLLSNIIENISFKDVERRLLISLVESANASESKEDVVTLSLTHQEIASMIGTVREVVSRIMAKLKRKMIVFDTNPGEFKIGKAAAVKYMKKAVKRN